jgi:integrase
VSPSYRTPEQYERWHVRDCARCGRRAGLAANWPDGPICRTCYHKAARTRGWCPGCGASRLLPGRRADQAPICRDCAAITRDFFCDHCGFEGLLLRGRLCERCTLSGKLTAALDDGTGHISTALTPLFDTVTAMTKPQAGLDWLSNNPQVGQLLTGLATGQIPLTHQALAELPNWRTVAYLRDLLMACGVLPVIDKQVLHFETWLHHRLAGLGGQADTAVLRQYALWHQLARMRRDARARPLPASTAKSAMAQFNSAARLCAWLHGQGRNLTRATQADIDAWHAAARPYARQPAHAFLTWAIKTGHMPRRALPPLRPSHGGPALTAAVRLDLLRRALTDDQAPVRTRAAACLLLLFAQPVTRIVRLTIDDITDQDGQLLLRLGDPPVPVPEPFAGLLLQLTASRQNTNTATNPASRWLFPGRRAGQPLHPDTLWTTLRQFGIPAGAARTAALRDLVRQAPVPVIARALGYGHLAAHRHATQAGQTWARYASGDHAQ